VTKPYSAGQLLRIIREFISEKLRECLVRFVGPLSGRHVNEMNFGSGSRTVIAVASAERQLTLRFRDEIAAPARTSEAIAGIRQIVI
jgi:hypothetical protein